MWPWVALGVPLNADPAINDILIPLFLNSNGHVTTFFLKAFLKFMFSKKFGYTSVEPSKKVVKIEISVPALGCVYF